MTLLEKRSGGQQVLLLEKRFIRTVLQEEGQDILAQQKRIMQRNGFKSRELIAQRRIDVTDTILSLEHLKRHRFIDMKRRRTSSGSIKKKNYPIHNRVLYGYANNVIRRLSFGFTEDTKEIMRRIK